MRLFRRAPMALAPEFVAPGHKDIQVLGIGIFVDFQIADDFITLGKGLTAVARICAKVGVNGFRQ